MRGVAQWAPLLPLPPVTGAPEVCGGGSNKPDPPFHPEQSTSPGLETKAHKVAFIQAQTRCLLRPLGPTAAVCNVRELLSDELQLIFHHTLFG